MTDPLHTEPVEVTQLRVASDRCYPGLHYIEGAPFRISFWTIATNIDPVEGVRRLRFADELVAAWNTRTAAEAASRQEVERLREALEGVATFLETAPLESGVCCCGDPIEGHGYHSGHSPVDQASYTAMLWAKDIRAALTASEGGEA